MGSEPPGRRPRGLRGLRKPAKKRPAGPPPPEVTEDSDTAEPPAETTSSVINAVLYRDGRRVSTHDTLAEAFRQQRATSGTLAWIGLYRPSRDELLTLAAEFDLHELAVEDAIEAHQRPKLERYGDTLFVVLRAARYLDDAEEVDFGELHVFVGQNFVITVRHSERPRPVRGPQPDGGRPRTARPRSRGGALRHPRRRRRRLRAGGRRPAERHRRDRDRGVRRRPPASPAASTSCPAR